ncbi:peptidylprolyl isomerase [Nodosilinea sp. FACHB-131]|uniref:peptidylprolyl isomerase n=1 Tax=Cyanophyceae TaxID=3028117 RepID=UPI0016842D0A|nr:peptidylprolyl isomerase [Nodosilinea sp. FACHB-131]MBD1876707.1 peptidylprolyl isomerase [Nodosilinea sp. FACHB-131]
MANLTGLSLDAQEVVDYLRQSFRLSEIYQEIIEQKIVSQVAIDNDVVVTLQEIEVEVENVRYEKEFDSSVDLMTWLSDRGTTLTDLKQSIHFSLLTQKVVRHLFLDQAEAVFSQQRSRFDQLVLYKIVVPYEHLAQEVFYQIEEEEISFFEAAHVYDIDENRRLNCGYEGKIVRSDLPSELAEPLLTARINEVIGPIKTANQFYELFWIDDVIAPTLTPALQDAILNQLYHDWMKDKINDYLASLSPHFE